MTDGMLQNCVDFPNISMLCLKVPFFYNSYKFVNGHDSVTLLSNSDNNER
jgi:hypothetical protein